MQTIPLGLPRRRGDEVGVSAPPPLALYVHLPWCLRKCPYCDFNSHEWGGGAAPPEDDYLAALQADLEWSLPLIWGRSVQTIFIGGGTPSLFSAGAIERLLTMIRTRIRLAPDAEITLEANPGTFEVERFRGFAAAGVTRLSIGAQSFSDAALVAIGRVHSAQQARAALDLAARAFGTFNVDLMYALPGQTLAALRDDLRILTEAGVPHWSCYQLTLEPGTAFAKRPPVLPDEDLAADMQAMIEAHSATAGLQQYEVSAYARPGQRCRHNLNYWQFGDYLGIGAGAHGKLSFSGRIVRQSRLRNPKRYMEALLDPAHAAAAHIAGEEPSRQALQAVPWVEHCHSVPAADLPFEFMLNALRLADGVPASLFEERCGLPLAALSGRLARALARGLLDPDPGRIQASPLGRRFLNDLQEIFLA